MRKRKIDHIGWGLLSGVIGTFLGFFLFGTVWAWSYNLNFSYFVEEIWLNTPLFRDKIITVSVLFNVLIFALAFKLEWYEYAKGIMAIILISVPFIIYFA